MQKTTTNTCVSPKKGLKKAWIEIYSRFYHPLFGKVKTFFDCKITRALLKHSPVKMSNMNFSEVCPDGYSMTAT